jgi:2-keto-4-pentenoate hydratase
VSAGEAGVARGMARQLESLTRRLAAGAERAGWKVGLNVPAVQEHLGIERPVVGHLTSETRLDAGTPVRVGAFTRAGLEPEIAATVGPRGEVESVAPAVEIVDIDLPFDTVEPIVAANVFHRGWLTGAARASADVDLGEVDVVVVRNGAVEHEANAARAMGDVAAVVAGVGERLTQAGESLRAGDVVICGSLTPIVGVGPGDEAIVRFGALGELRVTFAQ